MTAAGLPDLPDLHIVPTESLQAHESVDVQRADPLAERLRKEGVLRNPPVVIPAGDRGACFVVLDGANRTQALQALGLPHVLVQVVHAGAAAVELRTWNHVVRGVPPSALLETIERYPEIALVPSDRDRAAFNLSAGATLAYIELRHDWVLEVVAETRPLAWRVRNLSHLVTSYLSLGGVERTSATQVEHVGELYPDFAGLVVFRPFAVEEVVSAAANGWLLPAGLTRFVITPRALRVNYPLDRLAAEIPLADKQAELATWLQGRISGRHVRFYAESTFLFDE